MKRTIRSSIAPIALLACFACGTSPAATLRDPTQPPAALAAPPKARAAGESFRPAHVVIVDGRHYLLWQGRRYAVGDTLLGARIERIAETEVLLSSRDGVRRLPLFAGIEKKGSKP